MSKTLITGGAGFVGEHLTRQLVERGNEVVVVDNLWAGKRVVANGGEFLRASILDRDVLAKAMHDVDVVYHLAGILGTHETVTQPILATQVNVIGTLNVLELARDVGGCQIVYPTKPNVWLNPYTISKIAAEQYCVMFRREFAVSTVLLRWFNAYGPGQRAAPVQKCVPAFIEAALDDRPLPIYGDGQQTGDFIYVDDVVEATIRAGENEVRTEEVVDVGTGTETSVIDLAHLIIELTGSSSSLEHFPMRRGEEPGTHLAADPKTMERELSFRPRVGLLEGLKRTVTWSLENGKET